MKALEDYIQEFSKPLPLAIQKIMDSCEENQHMICGPIVGQFLNLMVQIIQPKNILELGTMKGFSTLSLALSLPQNSKIYTIEKNEKDYLESKQNFISLGQENKIHSYLGTINEILPTLDLEFDLIFIDADKINYINYYEMCLKKLSPHGIIFVDNCLFHEMVLEEHPQNKNAQEIKKFNEFVTQDSRVTNVLLNIRDGIQMIRKKEI